MFMARVAPARWQPFLVAMVLTPLWASYLVKVYAWRTMLNPESGFLSWLVGWAPGFGAPGSGAPGSRAPGFGAGIGRGHQRHALIPRRLPL